MLLNTYQNKTESAKTKNNVKTTFKVTKFQDPLQGGDLRSIGKANEIVSMVKDQNDFDELFSGLYHSDRK